MMNIPPLTKVRDLGGEEFEKLMHQLLLAHAESRHFKYEPHGKSGAAEQGCDGLALEGAGPGLAGRVGFQFKWLSGDLTKGGNASQITRSLGDTKSLKPALDHWVLVTPENISPKQKQWLADLGRKTARSDLKIHHWGHAKIRSLLRLVPEIEAEYYPESARQTTLNAAEGELRSAYLKALLKECAPLKLQAIDPGAGRADRNPLRLASIYVDLELDLCLPEKVSLLDHLNQPAREGVPGGDPKTRSDEAKQRRVAALEALGAHERMILLGLPGSGKSTLTCFLAVQLAEHFLNPKQTLSALGTWWKCGARVPLRVILRDFAASLPKKLAKGRAAHLWNFIEREMTGQGLAPETVPMLRKLASSQGVLFLLDGLDEAREADTRDRVLEAVTEFATTAGDPCRFLITARPYAWDEARASSKAGWATAYRLAQFSPAQIKLFNERWFAAVATLDWITKKEAAEKTACLNQAVDREDLLSLATNPLLLTLMATLLTNGKQLPDDRADLYDEVVRLLLQRWAETIGPERGLLTALNVSGLTMDHIRETLQQLAYEAHKGLAGHTLQNDLAKIPEGELLCGLKPLLGNELSKAEIALDYIEKRAGLLLGTGWVGHQRQFAFPHRTFQEFLAACHLADQHDFSALAEKHARENPAYWRETLLFAARMARANRGVPAADLLVHCSSFSEHGSKNALTDMDWRCAALAGEQLIEIGLASVQARPQHKTILHRVAGWLEKLIDDGALPPDERVRAGITLARLGDNRKGVGLRDGTPDIDWIQIPAGPFIMGENKGEHSCQVLDQSYRISRYPVTVAQFQAFVAAGGYAERRFWTTTGWEWRKKQKITSAGRYQMPFQTLNHPQVGVSWYEAMAFSRWLAERLGMPVGLPSEAEWERAARHTDGRKYPWGKKTSQSGQCNSQETGILHTSAVGMFPDGHAECGAADMAGNVWEWTRSLWGEDWREPSHTYPYESASQRENLDAPQNILRVLRGGSWDLNASLARCADRDWNFPVFRYNFVGFRLVASPFFSLPSGPSDL